MRLGLALASVPMLALPALALDAPASFQDAKIEVRPGVTPADALGQAAREPGTSWVGWSVRALPESGDVCCFTNDFRSRGCSLGEREKSWGTTSSGKSLSSAELYVLVETKDRKPSRVKVFAPSCPLDGADRRVVWLGPAAAKDSLAPLSRLLEVDSHRELQDQALFAIVQHDDALADSILEKRALDRSLSENSREQAVFWAGQARGETGFKLLDRVLTSEPSSDLREHAVFSLSQSSVPQAPERIKRVAVEDRDSQVRSHALFSLSQTNAPGSGEWIVGRLDAERDDDVREQAVFALSQLEDGTDWLLKVLRSKRDPETVRRALFWLGQSKDPRALDEIEKILD